MLYLRGREPCPRYHCTFERQVVTTTTAVLVYIGRYPVDLSWHYRYGPGETGCHPRSAGNTQLLIEYYTRVAYMADYLSEGDLERMEQFASTPKYKRDPEQLVPNEGE